MMHAESLQSVAEAKYLPLQANAVGELRRAGRRFGTALERDRINTVLTAKQVAQGRKQLRRLDGIPRSLVNEPRARRADHEPQGLGADHRLAAQESAARACDNARPGS